VVPADWTATDSESGILNEVGTVDKGQPIDTSTPGTKTFSVTVTDLAGNSTKVPVNYQVIYKTIGVLQPINADKSSQFKLGSTVPVKFQLTDANGASVTNATATIKTAKVSNNITGTFYEAASTSAATTGNLFRYDSASNQYIFNLATKCMASGTYEILIDIKQGTELIQTITATISLK
jgi:hypothetical protein